MTSRKPHLPPGARLEILFVLLIALLSIPALAQQPSAAPTPAQSSQPQDKSKSQDGQDKTSSDQTNSPANDRIFYAVPNFLTVENAGQVPPVSAGRKFKLVAEDSFDFFNYPWYGFLAGLAQAENSEPGYGQGAKGYAKRYAATFADGTIENFMTGGVFPALLHQDPRYFQMGKGTFLHRAGYAVSRIFITR